MSIKKHLGLLLLALTIGVSANAQKVALKTNILYDATATVNLGVEFGMAPRWTMDLSANLNAWSINGCKWKHWMVQPEARFWFGDRFAGHFLGIHALGGQYAIGNMKVNKFFKFSDKFDLTKLNHRFIGGWVDQNTDAAKEDKKNFAVGAGIAYGYAFILGRHWNLELELGVGYIYTKYSEYECRLCTDRPVVKNESYNYVGPTKAALNLVYVF